MSAIVKLMKYFWKNVEKSDAKNIASQTEPAGIERVYDVPYIDDGHRLHKLDVLYPEGTEEKLPVIIDVHGGGWMYGDKELNRMYCLNLAKRGYTVFDISYRLVPEVTVYEELQDVMKALEFIQKHLDNYPCDREHIMLTGDSAGGMLAAYAAALLSSGELRTAFGTVDPEMKLTALLLTSPVAFMKTAGATSVYTRVMWGDDYKKKPCFNYMDLDEIAEKATFPPTCLVTSSGDSIAHEPTKRAARLLVGNGVDTLLLDYPKFDGVDLPHVFAVLGPAKPAGVDAIDKTLEFFRNHIQ